MDYKKIGIAVLWWFLAFIARAQPVYFTKYQVEQGLSNNAVICSLQDRYGFLWFGTKDGLNRFDGYHFKIYRQGPESPQELSSNFIRALLEDQRGNIWAGTDQGIYLFNPKTEEFRLFRHDISGEILSIKQAKDGSIWFIANRSVYSYRPQNNVLTEIDPTKTVLATALCIADDQTIWVGGQNGVLYQWHINQSRFIEYSMFNHSDPVVSPWIEKIKDDGKGGLFVGTAKQGMKRFDRATGTYRDLLSKNPDGTDLFVRDIIARKNNEYWIASESGIFIYNDQTNHYTNLRKQYTDPWALSDNAVYSLCLDKEGGLWIGTYFGGVNYYTDQHQVFEKFFPIPGKNSISGNAVREISKDRFGDLWIATEDGGLNRFSPESGLFEQLKANGKPGSICSNNIHGILASGDTLWVGTFEHGLDWLSIRSGKVFRHFDASALPGNLHNNFIFHILKTKKGQIMLATGSGIYTYSTQKDTFTPYSGFPEFIFYTTLYEDHKGVLWAGSWRDGLFYSDPVTKKRGNYRRLATNINSLSNNRVTRTFEDSHQRLWIATESGLCLMPPNSHVVQRVTKTPILSENLILNILEDENGQLWITTTKGLVRYHPEKNESILFTIADGLLSDQFNYNSGFRDSNGDIYFGSVKGLVRFNPKNLQDDPYNPPVWITGFQVGNKELELDKAGSQLKKSITFTDSIRLKYDQSTFSIDFAALGFASPKMTRYAYRLDGLDHEWTQLTETRKAVFTKLSPGDYTFRVNAFDGDGSAKGREKKLFIRIDPPFWASTQAYLLYAILSIGLFFYIIREYHHRVRIKNKRKLEALRHKKEEELYQAKMDFFTNIAHEIKTPLTLIKAPLESLIGKTKEQPLLQKHLLTMERNTERLIELTGQLLDFRKTEVQGFSLHFEKTDVKKLIDENYQRFKPAAARKKMSLHITTPETPLNIMADEEALHKIISNLLNNALKYGHKKILLIASQTETTSCIQVKSDGNQIPYEMRDKIFETFYRLKKTDGHTGTGLGLALSRTLATLHNGTLILSPPEDGLNVFTLVLPNRQI